MMKGFLIGIGILTALGIAVLTQYERFGEKLLETIEAEEGQPPAIKEAALKNPKSFIDSHRPFILKRWRLAWAGTILNADDFSAKVAASTLERYLETPLETDPELGRQLFLLASLKEKVLPPVEAHGLYKLYAELFPAGEKVVLARNALTNMAIKYGMQ